MPTLNRKILVIAAIAVVVSLILAATALGYLGGTDKRDYNVVEIYVLSWDINTTHPNDVIDVEFRISVDSNNDSEFDLVRTSGIFRNTTVETAPFRVGNAIPTSVNGFHFKIEVLKLVNGDLVPMDYSGTGSVPICDGINDVTFARAWSYDGTGSQEGGAVTCRISFLCYIDANS